MNWGLTIMRIGAVLVVLGSVAVAGCAPKYSKPDASYDQARADLRTCKYPASDAKRRVLVRGGSREAAADAARGAFDACARKMGYGRAG
jgi:hypothetical protein